MATVVVCFSSIYCIEDKTIYGFYCLICIRWSSHMNDLLSSWEYVCMCVYGMIVRGLEIPAQSACEFSQAHTKSSIFSENNLHAHG